MKLCKMSFVYIEQINNEWFIIGKGHPYNPEGPVYLWPDGVWSSMPPDRHCYPSRANAEDKLAEVGIKEGFQ